MLLLCLCAAAGACRFDTYVIDAGIVPCKTKDVPNVSYLMCDVVYAVQQHESDVRVIADMY
jgi:hypothetical protein